MSVRGKHYQKNHNPYRQINTSEKEHQQIERQ